MHTITAHRAWDGKPLAGTPGYSLPDLTRAAALTLTPETLGRAKYLGFDVRVLDGVNNKIVFFETGSVHKLQLDFRGNNNLIVIGEKTKIAGTIAFEDAGGHLFMVSAPPS